MDRSRKVLQNCYDGLVQKRKSTLEDETDSMLLQLSLAYIQISSGAVHDM